MGNQDPSPDHNTVCVSGVTDATRGSVEPSLGERATAPNSTAAHAERRCRTRACNARAAVLRGIYAGRHHHTRRAPALPVTLASCTYRTGAHIPDSVSIDVLPGLLKHSGFFHVAPASSVRQRRCERYRTSLGNVMAPTNEPEPVYVCRISRPSSLCGSNPSAVMRAGAEVT
jgi:hypothetical protein